MVVRLVLYPILLRGDVLLMERVAAHNVHKDLRAEHTPHSSKVGRYPIGPVPTGVRARKRLKHQSPGGWRERDGRGL